MSRPSQFVVLAEDQRNQRFVRAYLKRLFRDPPIRNIALPSSRGSGEQWVRENYAKELAAYRYRSACAQSALVVVIDADNGEVTRRVRQLEEALTSANMSARTANEKVVHWIPRRSIETWVLCLCSNVVDETTDYKNAAEVDDLIRRSGEEFYNWCRVSAPVPRNCVPSLATAIPEARRLETWHNLKGWRSSCSRSPLIDHYE